jgi:hypothetical protein
MAYTTPISFTVSTSCQNFRGNMPPTQPATVPLITPFAGIVQIRLRGLPEIGIWTQMVNMMQDVMEFQEILPRVEIRSFPP